MQSNKQHSHEENANKTIKQEKTKNNLKIIIEFVRTAGTQRNKKRKKKRRIIQQFEQLRK